MIAQRETTLSDVTIIDVDDDFLIHGRREDSEFIGEPFSQLTVDIANTIPVTSMVLKSESVEVSTTNVVIVDIVRVDVVSIIVKGLLTHTANLERISVLDVELRCTAPSEAESSSIRSEAGNTRGNKAPEVDAADCLLCRPQSFDKCRRRTLSGV